MTQAWAWVSSKGRVAVATVRKSRERAIGACGEIWSGQLPMWFSDAAWRGDVVTALAAHGWHLKRVNVEPVEG